MTTPSNSAVPQGPPSEEEEDHDLLTYGVAEDRLREEILLEKSRLSAAERSGDDTTISQERVAALEAAFKRHREARDSAFNEKQFFGDQFEAGREAP
ncbi:hypothetical protein [Nocardioides massiliensis]|uniref:Uncharacterized protein n=1 Tax=Nocardioides massiliensis TaxID=1325935 RepID=A0ABT9NLR5_9ACTN|nr:hypothetical protein [Nocardioides massiliensis]MDP9820760.1 hypothetical protein [Nocardioides massiliensis]